MTLVVSELTQAMQEALQTEWRAAKGEEMPEAGAEDRRLIFAAVARGLLTYLRAHQNDWLNTITFEDPGTGRVTHTVKATQLNITTNS